MVAGADIKVPNFFKFVIVYITPLLLIFVFVGSLFLPEGGDWAASLAGLFSGEGWTLDNGSIINMLQNKGIREAIANASDPAEIELLQDKIGIVNAARGLLVALFVGISTLVYVAYKKRLNANVNMEEV